jgi:hypothetical protein
VEEILCRVKEKGYVVEAENYSFISSISSPHSTYFFMEVKVKRGPARGFKKSGYGF